LQQNMQLWEDFRPNYVFRTLFDPHFLAIWLATTAAVLALHAALRQQTAGRLLAAGILSGLTTAIHIYEGPLLVVIALAVALMLTLKRIPWRAWLPACLSCTLGAILTAGALVLVFRRADLPLPDWAPEPVLFASVALAYPLAWIPMLLGLGSWWRAADRDRCFLAGWALGCAVLTLSGPLYPYSDRGPMTWAIPLYVIAAGIWLERKGRLSGGVLVAAILIGGLTPLGDLRGRWQVAGFTTEVPARFVGPEHRELIAALTRDDGPDDILLTDRREYFWIAPDFRGRTWHGNYFNTPQWQQKRVAVEAFLATPDDTARQRFLGASGARFLYVPAQWQPESFDRLPGLRLMVRNAVGTLYEREPGVRAER
jgi:hypothetical protein